MIRPGRNIAMKIPPHLWDETLAFYRDRLGLSVTHEAEESVGLLFGDVTLWLDRVAHQSQTDLWLELISDDPTEDVARLGGPLRDELEPLGDVSGHWTSDPAGTVLLVRKPMGDEA